MRRAGVARWGWVVPAASAGAAVAVLVVLVLSGWWMAFWRAPHGWYAGVRSGRLVIGRNTELGLRVTGVSANHDPFRWKFEKRDDDSKPGMPPAFFYLYVPLWAPAALLGLPTGAWVLRRARGVVWGWRGRCRVCGYALAGVEDSGEAARGGRSGAVQCPECGAGAR